LGAGSRRGGSPRSTSVLACLYGSRIGPRILAQDAVQRLSPPGSRGRGQTPCDRRLHQPQRARRDRAAHLPRRRRRRRLIPGPSIRHPEGDMMATLPTTPAAPDPAAAEDPAFTVMPLRYTEDAPAMIGFLRALGLAPPPPPPPAPPRPPAAAPPPPCPPGRRARPPAPPRPSVVSLRPPGAAGAAPAPASRPGPRARGPRPGLPRALRSRQHARLF